MGDQIVVTMLFLTAILKDMALTTLQSSGILPMTINHTDISAAGLAISSLASYDVLGYI